MIDDIHDVIGLIGVFLILISYVLLQLERIKANSLSYSIINLVGAILILYSLFYNCYEHLHASKRASRVMAFFEVIQQIII